MRASRLLSFFILALGGPPKVRSNHRSAVSDRGKRGEYLRPASPAHLQLRHDADQAGARSLRWIRRLGPFTINKAITIHAAPGAYAGVTGTGGGCDRHFGAWQREDRDPRTDSARTRHRQRRDCVHRGGGLAPSFTLRM